MRVPNNNRGISFAALIENEVAIADYTKAIELMRLCECLL